MSSKTINMTSGSPIHLMIRFCLPVMVGSIFQQIYNITDSIVVGNCVGSSALAAIGTTGSSTFFLLALASGLTSSFSILLSQSFGSGDEQKIRRILAAAIYVTLAAALVLSLVGIFGSAFIMQLLDAPADIIADATLYLQICIGGCLGLLVYNAAAAVLRSVGNSKIPLLFLILTCVLNVILDLVFVLAFGLGVMGVAVATVVSQWIAAAACVIYTVKAMPIFRLTRRDMRPDAQSFREILKIGLPISLQSMLLAVGDMVVTRVINAFNTEMVAAFSTVTRINNLASLSFSSIAHSFSVYTGQNAGARDVGRIRQGVNQISLLVMGLSLVSSAAVWLFGQPLLQLFVPPDDPNFVAVLPMASYGLKVYACFFAFLGLIWTFNGALRGMGEVLVPLSSGLSELVLKVGLSIAFARLFGHRGTWFAAPIGWVIGLLPSLIRFYSGGWQKKLRSLPRNT